MVADVALLRESGLRHAPKDIDLRAKPSPLRLRPVARNLTARCGWAPVRSHAVAPSAVSTDGERL